MGKSKDAYFEQKGNLFIVGTRKIEKVLELTADQRFVCRSVRAKETGKELIWKSPVATDEFFVTVNDVYYSGAEGNWNFVSAEEKILSQGELETVITLNNEILEVKRHYVAYPGEPVIQEWTEYTNISGQRVLMSRPSLFVWRILGEKPEQIDFSYMTGGANF